MKNTKKMILVPFQDGRGTNDDDDDRRDSPGSSVAGTEEEDVAGDAKNKRGGNRIRTYAADRQRKMLTVVLKLAVAGAYDELGQFRTLDNEPLDIIPLLIYALSPGRNITGLTDFVRLLADAGVEPGDVINSHVKDMLIRRRNGPKKNYTRTTRNPRPPPHVPPLPKPQPRQTFQMRDELMDQRTKRLMDDDDDADDTRSETGAKRHKNTESHKSETALDKDGNEIRWDDEDSDL